MQTPAGRLLSPQGSQEGAGRMPAGQGLGSAGAGVCTLLLQGFR